MDLLLKENVNYLLFYCWCHRSSYTIHKTESYGILVFSLKLSVVVREKFEKEQ